MPGSTQAIGMACVFTGMAVGRGHAARILQAFSTLPYARRDLRADRSAGMSERDQYNYYLRLVKLMYMDEPAGDEPAGVYSPLGVR